MNFVKKTIAITFSVICLSVVACSDDNPFSNGNSYLAEKSFSYEIEVLEQTQFVLEGIAGTITVTGLDGFGSVKITGERRVESFSQSDADAELERLKVNVQDLSEEVIVRTTQPNSTRNRNYIVDYTIRLPRDMRVVVGNVSGGVTISMIHNNVSVTSVSGNVELDDIIGSVYTGTVSGNVEGHIVLPLEGTINLGAVSGNIDLFIPQYTSADFSASVVSGKIRLSNFVLEDIVQTENTLRGVCGEGRGTILLGTISGNIDVTGQ